MSHATVIAFWPGERLEVLREIPDAQRLAWLLWESFSRRYLGLPMHELQSKQSLWDLWKRSDIPKPYRRALLMTCDNATIAAQDYTQAAEDIRALAKDFPHLAGPGSAWENVAQALESGPASPWVGLWGTSICANPFQGPFNETTEEYDPADPSGFWSVYSTSLQ